jgi:hypothetical protein
LAHPEIDPHNLEDDFDMEVLLEHIKYIRSMRETEPWKSGIVGEADPGPEYATDEQLRGEFGSFTLPSWRGLILPIEYVKKVHSTCWRTCNVDVWCIFDLNTI